MPAETSKSNFHRRTHEINFLSKFFSGNGIDIGAGANPLNHLKIPYRDSNVFGNYRFYKKNSLFPKIENVKIYSSDWNKENTAENILQREGVKKYNFVYSSNLLEHVEDFQRALLDFSLLLKEEGYLIAAVPDFEMYEKEIWPPIKNNDHKFCFSLNKDYPIDCHINLSKILTYHKNLDLIKLELADTFYDESLDSSIDQTNNIPYGAECFIEFVLKLNNNKGFTDYITVSEDKFNTLNSTDRHLLILPDKVSEHEKQRIENLPYVDTYINLSDDVKENNYPLFINKDFFKFFNNK
jgi:hypothetical protein